MFPVNQREHCKSFLRIHFFRGCAIQQTFSYNSKSHICIATVGFEPQSQRKEYYETANLLIVSLLFHLNNLKSAVIFWVRILLVGAFKYCFTLMIFEFMLFMWTVSILVLILMHNPMFPQEGGPDLRGSLGAFQFQKIALNIDTNILKLIPKY